MIREHKIFRIKVTGVREVTYREGVDGDLVHTGEMANFDKTINVIAKHSEVALARTKEYYRYAGIELKFEVIEEEIIDILLFEPTW